MWFSMKWVVKTSITFHCCPIQPCQIGDLLIVKTIRPGGSTLCSFQMYWCHYRSMPVFTKCNPVVPCLKLNLSLWYAKSFFTSFKSLPHWLLQIQIYARQQPSDKVLFTRVLKMFWNNVRSPFIHIGSSFDLTHISMNLLTGLSAILRYLVFQTYPLKK